MFYCMYNNNILRVILTVFSNLFKVSLLSFCHLFAYKKSHLLYHINLPHSIWHRIYGTFNKNK